MQILMLLFKVSIIAYLVLWAILLVLCFRRKQFWPLLEEQSATRYFWLFTFFFINPILTILYLVFGQLRPSNAKPNRFVLPSVLVFIILGFYLNFPGATHLWMQPFLGRDTDENKKIQFHAQLATIEANNHTNTSSSSSHSDNSRLACKTVTILCKNDHSLMQQTSKHLKQLIEEIPYVETVNYYIADSLQANGKRAPDIFIHLDMNQFKHNIWPYNLKIEAEIKATMTNRTSPRNTSYIDNRTPPLISYSIDLNLTHKSETNGYESPKYNMAAKNIAEQLSDELAKNLKKFREKHGLLPELPDDFYGEYNENELPEPLKSLEVTRLFSCTGLMKVNDTVYQLDISGDYIEELKQLHQQMIDLGWKGSIPDDFDEQFVHLRFRKGNREIIISKQDEYSSSLVTISQSSDKNESTRLYINDVEFISDESLYSAIDKLLEEPVDIEKVMLFETMANNRQKDKIFDLLRTAASLSLSSQLHLAEMYESRNMLEESQNALIRAAALFWLGNDNTLRTCLTNLAKKLGDEELAEQEPDREILLDIGLIEITEDTGPFEMEVGLNEQIRIFAVDDEGGIEAVSFSFIPSEENGKSNNPYSLSYIIRKDSSTSWGTKEIKQGYNRWDIKNFTYDFPDLTFSCNVIPNNNGQFSLSFK